MTERVEFLANAWKKPLMRFRDCVVYSSHWSLSQRASQAFGAGPGGGVRRGAQPGMATTGGASKSLLHEVFGPVGTVAGISYFEVNSDPRRVEGARPPWSPPITANATDVMGNVVAQGDSTALAAGSW